MCRLRVTRRYYLKHLLFSLSCLLAVIGCAVLSGPGLWTQGATFAVSFDRHEWQGDTLVVDGVLRITKNGPWDYDALFMEYWPESAWPLVGGGGTGVRMAIQWEESEADAPRRVGTHRFRLTVDASAIQANRRVLVKYLPVAYVPKGPSKRWDVSFFVLKRESSVSAVQLKGFHLPLNEPSPR